MKNSYEAIFGFGGKKKDEEKKSAAGEPAAGEHVISLGTSQIVGNLGRKGCPQGVKHRAKKEDVGPQ